MVPEPTWEPSAGQFIVLETFGRSCGSNTVKRLLIISLCIPVFLELGCKENIADRPFANQTPRTYLWLFPDSTIGVGVSRQHIRWWGDDPDGVILGYLFSFAVFPNQVTTLPNPDTLRYTFVTSNDTLIAFPLDTLFSNFTVFVRAVDNTFPGVPNQSIIRLTPRPYWDKNDDGVLDANDIELPSPLGALDPIGAVQTFPVRNTPPAIVFAQNPSDPNVALKQPDTTFTVATFAFKGSDFDGDNTLLSYRIALNDTSNPNRWLTLSLRDTVITLVVPRSRSDSAITEVDADVYAGQFLGRRFIGQVPGLLLDALNVFYVQIKDVAGEFSQPVAMPSGANHWYVMRPRGRLLMVADDVSYGIAAETAYRSALSNVPGGEFTVVDKLNIALGLNANTKSTYWLGRLMPPFQDPALIFTFLLYDYVFWYTEQIPMVGVAQVTLFQYMQNGGRVIFSTTFEASADPRGALRDFAPIDSISSVDLSPTRPPVPPPVAGDTRLFGSYLVFADSSTPGNIYPNLQFNGDTTIVHSIFMRPIYRRSDSRYIYRLQASTRNRYIGMPNIGVVDGQGTIVFIGLPLHLLNNTTAGGGLTAFFTKTLTESFRLSQSVDRMKF